MKRREFLGAVAGAGVASTFGPFVFAQEGHDEHALCHPTYATPADAMKAPPEKFAFVPAILVGTKTKRPDYMATVDIDPESSTFGQVVGRFDMPIVGDELHHYGWNACSSCHGERHRRYLVVPGLASGNIYIVDAADPKNLKMHKQISGKDIAAKTDLSTPHTVHCLADGTMMISMLGDADGNAPGGFLLIDESFEIKGRWEKDAAAMKFNYDFWYQPGINAMVSSEWAAPNTVAQGFKLEDVKAGKYGQQLHFWDWKERKIEQTVNLGEKGMIPLEVRFHHDPSSSHGFVGAALSSVIWHWQKKDKWVTKPIVEVEPVDTEGWPFPVPGLITDLVLSLDDKFLYFANWLHGDIRQYDVSDPANPKLTGQVWLGGVIGHKSDMKKPMTGGPQMLQLSKNGKRLFVTSSLYSVWDNQFYPKMADEGSWMAMIDCDTENGGMKLNHDFLVDFGKEPYGPARAHEIRFPDGDSTSDIWELAEGAEGEKKKMR